MVVRGVAGDSRRRRAHVFEVGPRHEAETVDDIGRMVSQLSQVRDELAQLLCRRLVFFWLGSSFSYARFLVHHDNKGGGVPG